MIRTQSAAIIENQDVVATNKTGSAVVVGGIYSLDITASDGSSTTPDLALGNVVAVATANLRGLLVVALSAIAAGAVGNFRLVGRCNVLVDGSGTNIAKGDRLKPANATNTLTQLAATQLNTPCALALATATTAGALIDALFDGRNWMCERAAS